jgi:hypothetical protein
MSEWNRYQESVLKKWSSMSKTYSTMHSISSEYYSKWDKRLGIPVILLGAVTASSIFTTGTESNTNNIWTYINGGVVLLMTGISGVSRFLGTSEKQAKHTSAAFKYTHISMNIDTLLSFPRMDRQENPRQFINEIKLSMLEVREHSPDLDTSLVSEYINKFDKSLTNTNTKANRHTYNHINRKPNRRDCNSTMSLSDSEGNRTYFPKSVSTEYSYSVSPSRSNSHVKEVVLLINDNTTEPVTKNHRKRSMSKFNKNDSNRIDKDLYTDLYTDFLDSPGMKTISDKLQCYSQSETEFDSDE